MIFVIGEILIDIFPDYQRIGGAPFNFAFHLKRLGFPVRFISRVGDDAYGRRIGAMLEAHGFDNGDLQIDDRHPTGSVKVSLDEQGVPTFDILADVAYDYLDLEPVRVSDSQTAAMTYFGSLLQRTDRGRRRVQRFLAQQSGRGVRFCDINMRPPHVNRSVITESLQQADLLKLNEAELVEIQSLFEAPTDTPHALDWLRRTFSIATVALTRGHLGSTLLHGEGTVDHPAVTGQPIVDTVGAGDGYAAILAAGLLQGIDWAVTIRGASRFAGRICGIPGAVPEEESFYNDFDTFRKGNADGR